MDSSDQQPKSRIASVHVSYSAAAYSSITRDMLRG